MKNTLLSVAAFFLVFSFAAGCNKPVPPAASAVATTTDPDQLLQQMSAKLAQSKNLSFKVERKLDAALVDGRSIPEDAQINVYVSRPGKFLSKSQSADGTRDLIFDGQNLTVYDETMKLYSSVPAPGTIDESVAKVNDTYGFTPPLAEFILSDPYKSLSPRIKSSAYKGKETVDGVDCNHLSFGGEVADSELWLGVADSLPRKLVATFKDRDGNPQLQVDFSDWNLAATTDDKFFTFTPPADAANVEMVTEAQMTAAAAKAASHGK